jgi:hypothetical protein
MPRGPKGEKRPADVIGNAVHVMRVATGEIEEKQRKHFRGLYRHPRSKGRRVRPDFRRSDPKRDDVICHYSIVSFRRFDRQLDDPPGSSRQASISVM